MVIAWKRKHPVSDSWRGPFAGRSGFHGDPVLSSATDTLRFNCTGAIVEIVKLYLLRRVATV